MAHLEKKIISSSSGSVTLGKQVADSDYNGRTSARQRGEFGIIKIGLFTFLTFVLYSTKYFDEVQFMYFLFCWS